MLFAEHHFRKRLLPLIDEIALRKYENDILNDFQQELRQAVTQLVPGESAYNQFSVLVIGGCTGGPAALFKIFEHLNSDLSVPVVLVQHCPKIYTRELAKELHKSTDISVREAYNEAELKPGVAWIAPGGYHLEIQQEGKRPVLKVHKGLRINGVRPSIDVLFRSASRLYGERVLGIVLSGSGADGLGGAESIQNNGGTILVQDPKTALAGSLPKAVLQKDITKYAIPLGRLGIHLAENLGQKESFTAKTKKMQPNKFSSSGLFLNSY